jgi:hypothetical protein
MKVTKIRLMNMTKEEFELAVKKQFEEWNKNASKELYGGAFDRLCSVEGIQDYIQENGVTIRHNWQTGEIIIEGPTDAVEKIRDIMYKAPPETKFAIFTKNEPANGEVYNRMVLVQENHKNYLRDNKAYIRYNWMTGEVTVGGPSDVAEKIWKEIYNP